jgi:uncharacterized phosphosugar-binding protein
MNIATDTDMILIRNDLSELKRDMSNLMKHIGSSASHSVDDMGHDLKDNTDKMMHNMSCQGNKALKAMQNEIGTHPTLTASLILAASLITARMMMKKS